MRIARCDGGEGMIQPDNDVSSVQLTIPMRAEYVGIARLTAAGVANRLGFDIEIIEDIKVSLSEVCNRIINTLKKFSSDNKAECKIDFISSADSLSIDFYVDNTELLNHFDLDSLDSHSAGANAANGAVDNHEIVNGSFGNDNYLEENFEDQLQLSLITLLMDEYDVNPGNNCLISMKKYLE